MATLVENAKLLVADLAGMLRDAKDVLAQARAEELTANDDPAGRFITVKGHAVFIPEGKDVGEALKEHFAKFEGKESDAKGGGKETGKHRAAMEEHKPGAAHGTDEHGHGKHEEEGHGHHDPLEHAGHQAHDAQDLHVVGEALGGHAAAHEAVHAAHSVGEAAHAAGHAAEHVGDAAHHAAGVADVAAIGARHLIGPMTKAAAGLMESVPGLRTMGVALGKLHEGCKRVADAMTAKIHRDLGPELAGAVLGLGSAGVHVMHGIAGVHGPVAHAVPGQHLVAAVPLYAIARAGQKLGLLHQDGKVVKSLRILGTAISAISGAAGKAKKAVGEAGLKMAHGAGKATERARRVLGKLLKKVHLTGNEETNAEDLLLVNQTLDELEGLSGAVTEDELREFTLNALVAAAEAGRITDNELTELLNELTGDEGSNGEERCHARA